MKCTVIFTDVCDVCDVLTILQYLLCNYTLEFYTQEVLVLTITVDLFLWILLTINVKGLP